MRLLTSLVGVLQEVQQRTAEYESKLYAEYDSKLKNLSDFMVDAVDEYLAEKTELIVDAIEQGDKKLLKKIKKQAHDVVRKVAAQKTKRKAPTKSQGDN